MDQICCTTFPELPSHQPPGSPKWGIPLPRTYGAQTRRILLLHLATGGLGTRPSSRCQGRWLAWPCVWGTRLRPCKQIVSAGRGRMRPLPAGAVKRTASGIASEVKSEGPGPDVTGLDTLNRSLAMELRPLGLPPLGASIQQLQSPHRDKRSVHGARVDAQSCSNAAPGTTHGVTACAPSPDLGEEPEASLAVRSPA